MTMRPEDIKNRTFGNALRGYDKDEVRSFLFKVADSSRELHEKLTATEEQLASASAPVGDGLDAAAFNEDQDTVIGSVDDELLIDEPASDDGLEGSPAVSLADAEQSIADRYGALGDRIADLLRSADESATDMRSSAELESEETRAAAQADADQVRSDAGDHAAGLLSEARAIRQEADEYHDEVMAGLASARLEQESTLSAARAAVEAEVETYRVGSIDEIQSLRSTAAQDADAVREEARAEGAASIVEESEAAERLRQEAENDRLSARAELEDVRSEVSNLLEQARTQSEFIKQEADEIIRTKVRSNYEQAQTRIDVLRNTEIASRERIVRAQTELSGALNRLDSEPAPALDAATAPAVIEEAERRHEELYSAPGADDEYVVSDAIDTAGVDTAVVDAEVIDTDVSSPSDPTGGETSIGRETFEADIAEANQQFGDGAEDDSLSDFFGPSAAEESAGQRSILAGSFAPVVDSAAQSDSDEQGSDEGQSSTTFEVTEHVVVEPAEASAHDEDRATERSAEDGFGAATLADALSDEDGEDPEGRTEEDALARLVREAMQEAVDSAREQD